MEIVLAAFLTAFIGGPIMWLLHRVDQRNTKQHSENLNVLESIRTTVDQTRTNVSSLDRRFTRHLEWHMSPDREEVN